MKFLVVGSGGREHAIVWKLSQSPQMEKIYCAPGNGGIAEIAECVDIDILDFQGLSAFAREKGVDLTLIGPETPLVKGIVDHFRHEGLIIFGPTASAAKLEGSKVFSKKFMEKYHIPTARSEIFFSATGALDYIQQILPPIVIKVDGLASGKGVLICKTREEAREAITSILGKKIFGDAGKMILIEEHLDGEELSAFALCNGKNYVMLPFARDYKRAHDRDKGPNTGGMGAYSPVPNIKNSTKRFVEEKVIKIVLDGMKHDGIPFTGFLYCGLMLTSTGPKVLEFNIRLGDPEAQVILPRLSCDLAELLNDILIGKTYPENKAPRIKEAATCVVMASGGYPHEYSKGFPIQGIDKARNTGALVFHAGTQRSNGDILTNGGRVLGITGLGASVKEAADKTYEAVSMISFNDCHYRKDIAQFMPLKKV